MEEGHYFGVPVVILTGLVFGSETDGRRDRRKNIVSRYNRFFKPETTLTV